MKKKFSAFGSYDILTFVIAIAIFSAIFYFDVYSDIQTHAQITQEATTNILVLPANFLYYLVIYSLAFFHARIQWLYASSVLVLAFSVAIKYIITRKFIANQLNNLKTSEALRNKWINLFSFTLIFAFSIPLSLFIGGHYYLGQFPPNIWHNSTTIFLMPFALILFWLSYEQLKNPSNSRIYLLTLFSILNVLAKPSFFFSFLVIFPLLLIVRFRFKKDFWLNLIPIAVGTSLVLIEYILLYKVGSFNPYVEQTGIVIKPFSVWTSYSPNILISLLSSLIFPITYLMFYWKELKTNLLLQYSVLLYFISVVIFSLLTETGPREFYGNFFWQCVVSSYILFMVILSLLLEKIFSGSHSKKNILILTSFLLHVLSGIVYVILLFALKTYNV